MQHEEALVSLPHEPRHRQPNVPSAQMSAEHQDQVGGQRGEAARFGGAGNPARAALQLDGFRVFKPNEVVELCIFLRPGGVNRRDQSPDKSAALTPLRHGVTPGHRESN